MAKKSHSPRTPYIYRKSKSEYDRPHHNARLIESVADVLNWEQELRLEYFGKKNIPRRERDAGTRLQEVWFRGTWKHFPLLPGIYRQDIKELIEIDTRDYWMFGEVLPKRVRQEKLEHKRLNVERQGGDSWAARKNWCQ